MLATVRQAAQDVGRACPTPAAFPLTLLGPSRDSIMATVEERPPIKLLMVFADGDLWWRYGLMHPCGRDARGCHTIPDTLDPDQLRALARRMPEMFEDRLAIGNGGKVATRPSGFAEAGCQQVLLADIPAVAYPMEEAVAAMGERARLLERLRQMVPAPLPRLSAQDS
jgi:hypothetical protein